MKRTKIEWADVSWNPIRGCTRVSEGCRHCYAERMAARHLPWMKSPTTGDPFAIMTQNGARWTGNVELIEDKIMEPLSWRHPRRVFVNSMSDLFHELVTEEWLYYILAVVAAAPNHTFMVLTKRSRLMLHRIRGSCATTWLECILRTQESLGIAAQGVDWPLPNLWLGVSVENQRAADDRIPDLLATPAALRFVSCEPLLGPVDLYTWLPMLEIERESRGPDDRYIDWVIVGGESGPGARPMHPDWARSLRDQCADAGVPFFFKQWGEWLPQSQCSIDGDTPTVANTGARWGVLDRAGNYFGETTAWNGRTGDASESGEVYVYRVGKRHAGRLLDGREWNGIPQWIR